ncbi:MAG: hypothetical protein J6V32_04585 [Elusimicrobiaceae bacterium]|nr:hypothetical protein [Elusimicrobiaceae bacterium]
MTIRQIAVSLLVGIFTTVPAAAFGHWDDFGSHVTANNVHAFTQDLGGLIGSGTYTTGRILGWGGFQIGPRAGMLFKMSKAKGTTSDERNQTALGDRSDIGGLFSPWLQADIGMPFRLDGFIRASSYDGLTIAGGGLRWGVTRPSEVLGSLQPMLVLAAHSASAQDFSATHYNASLVLSMKFKYFVPYVGGGVDYTTVNVGNGVGAQAADLRATREHASTPRATVGFNFKLPSYLDLSLAANYAHYGLGAEASLSLRF